MTQEKESDSGNLNKTILVIDDEKAVLDAASLILTRAGYSVICSESGRSAFAVLEKRAQTYNGNARTDLLVVDWKMPGWDGLRVLTEIRASAFKVIPIILMSGAVTREQLLTAAAKNATSVLLKPLDKDVLLAKVTELIGAGKAPA